MAASVVQLAKRAFIRVLLAVAAQYQVPLNINRDALDKDVVAAYRCLARRVHPDKGGRHEDALLINEAREKWEQARKSNNEVWFSTCGREGIPRSTTPPDTQTLLQQTRP